MASSPESALLTGFALGSGQSFLSSTLNANNWYDSKTDSWTLEQGALRTAGNALFGGAMGAATFWAGDQAGKFLWSQVGALSSQASSSRMATNAVMGWSFGAVSGSSLEALRQAQAREHLNAWSIAKQGLLTGTTTEI